jgi:ATPase subunit of ABC transporter with duplicated ATPase domains
MSATLQVRDLSSGYGAKALFDDLDLVVAPGDIVGLVGPNGAGKSTLLRTIAGELAPEAGSVSTSPPYASIGYLPQEPERREGETVAAFLARRTGVAAAQERYDHATAHYDADPDEYAEALDRWLALGGADLDERTDQVLADVGLTVGTDALMTSLSGGQAARAEAAEVRGDDPVAGGQVVHDVRPQLPGVREAVQQEDGRARSREGDVQFDSVDGDAAEFGRPGHGCAPGTW